MPNKHAQMLGRRGGQAKTEKKVKAARRNLRKFWKRVKAGDAPKPRVGWKKGVPRGPRKQQPNGSTQAKTATAS